MMAQHNTGVLYQSDIEKDDAGRGHRASLDIMAAETTAGRKGPPLANEKARKLIAQCMPCLYVERSASLRIWIQRQREEIER